MPDIIQNLIISASLLVFAILIAWLVFWLITRSIKRRGEAVRSVDMELFLVLIPKEAPPGQQQPPIQERIEPMEQLYAVFSSMHDQGFWQKWEFGRPHVTWEMVFKGGKVYFYVAAPSRYSETLVRAIHAVYPDAVVEKTQDHDIFSADSANSAAYVVTDKPSVLPVRTYQEVESDPLSSVVTTLSQLDPEQDSAAVQVIMRPAPKGWGEKARKVLKEMRKGADFSSAWKEVTGFHMPSLSGNKKDEKETQKTSQPQDQPVIEQIERKARKNVFETNVRLAVASSSQQRSEAILGQLESTFNQFSSPTGNRFAEDREKMKRITYEYSFRLFDENRTTILSTEELASIFHLPLPGQEWPRVHWLKARSAPAPQGMKESGILLGENEYRGEKKEVRLARQDRRRHMYVIGQTGTGKTGLLQRMIHQDIERGEGVCLIDPHGDLVENVLGLVPQERWEDIILFDPTDLERPLGLNMLEYDTSRPEQKTFIVDELINIFNKLYDLSKTGGPMFEQYTRNALLLLLDAPEQGYTLMEVPRVFTDKEFRKALLQKSTNQSVQNFWRKEAEKAGGEASLENMIPYITSKFNVFLANDFMRPIIGQSKSSLNFRRIMDEGKILLVNLQKGRLGEKNMSLLGLIVVSKLMLASFARGDIPKDQRNDFYLYLDEFQNFTTDSISTILSEARKYRLNLTMAHQFLGQVPEDIAKAVFGNVGSMIMLRVGQEDAETLGEYLAPQFGAHDLINLDNFHAYVRLMLEEQTTSPFNIKLYAPHQPNPQTTQTVKQLSRTKHGREREVVEQEIERRSSALLKQKTPDQQSDQSSEEFTL